MDNQTNALKLKLEELKNKFKKSDQPQAQHINQFEEIEQLRQNKIREYQQQRQKQLTKVQTAQSLTQEKIAIIQQDEIKQKINKNFVIDEDDDDDEDVNFNPINKNDNDNKKVQDITKNQQKANLKEILAQKKQQIQQKSLLRVQTEAKLSQNKKQNDINEFSQKLQQLQTILQQKESHIGDVIKLQDYQDQVKNLKSKKEIKQFFNMDSTKLKDENGNIIDIRLEEKIAQLEQKFVPKQPKQI